MGASSIDQHPQDDKVTYISGQDEHQELRASLSRQTVEIKRRRGNYKATST